MGSIFAQAWWNQNTCKAARTILYEFASSTWLQRDANNEENSRKRDYNDEFDSVTNINGDIFIHLGIRDSAGMVYYNDILFAALKNSYGVDADEEEIQLYLEREEINTRIKLEQLKKKVELLRRCFLRILALQKRKYCSGYEISSNRRKSSARKSNIYNVIYGYDFESMGKICS